MSLSYGKRTLSLKGYHNNTIGTSKVLRYTVSMIRLRVKELATAKGISQARLSRLSDVDIKTMQKIFRHPYSVVTTETLNRIARALDVSVLDLIEDVPDDN